MKCFKMPNRGCCFDYRNSWTCYPPKAIFVVAGTCVANRLQRGGRSQQVTSNDCHDLAVRVVVGIYAAAAMGSGGACHNRLFAEAVIANGFAGSGVFVGQTEGSANRVDVEGEATASGSRDGDVVAGKLKY
jgi:hypothetical protein